MTRPADLPIRIAAVDRGDYAGRHTVERNTRAMSDDSHIPDELRPRIPDHELIRCIGRGSYGEVWLARTMMGGYRAVKVVYRRAFENDRPFQRELAGIRKFEPVSRSHEGFIDLLHVGQNEPDGYFYYVMELGDDEVTAQQIDPATYSPRTLAKEIQARGMLPVEECLRIGLSLSRAIGCLHQHRLVHRDIKPSNIIFVNGSAKLADIGLVTDIAQGASFVGTEGFIPPEGPGTAQADVYGLGKVLYEASTAKDRNDFPQLPAELADLPDPTPFLELNEIVVKACQTDRHERYRTALDLHADLMVLQNGKSVRRLHTLERRWAATRKVAVIGAIALAVAAAVYLQWAHERQHRAEMRQRQIGFELASGSHAMQEGDLLGSIPAFVRAFHLDDDNHEHEATHHLRLNAILAQCPRLVQMWTVNGRVNSAQFSPDGRRIVTAQWAGFAQVWWAESGAPVSSPFGRPSGVETAAFSPDGRLVVTANHDLTATLWDTITGKPLRELRHPNRVNSAAFSPDGRHVVTASSDRSVRVWDVAEGREVKRLGPHGDIAQHAAFSAHGRWIVTASRDHTAQIWDFNTGEKLGPPLPHKSWVYRAAFSPDNVQVVTAGFDRKARVWDVATGREVAPAMNHGDAVRCAAFSPDGAMIVTACWDGTARLWNATTHQPIDRVPKFRHGSRVMHAAFAPDGHRLVTACIDGTVRVWDLAADRLLPLAMHGGFSQNGTATLTVSNQFVRASHVSSNVSASRHLPPEQHLLEARLVENGKSLLLVSRSGSERRLHIWDALTLQPRSPPFPCSNALTNFRLSEDGRRLATFSGQLVSIRDVASGKPVAPPLHHDQPVHQALFSPDGRRLAIAAYPNATAVITAAVFIVDTTTGQSICPPLPHPTGISHAAFSPDGTRLVTCTSDPFLNERAAYIWDVRTGGLIGRPLEHRDGVLHASFDPDGRRVVTASEDFTAAVWDVLTGQPITPLLYHDDQVHTACFSHNGRWIITGSRDMTARLWDAETGEPMTSPLRHPSPLRHGVFLPDDSAIFTSDGSGLGWRWNLPRERRSVQYWEDLSQLLCGAMDRQIRPEAAARPPTRGDLQVRWQQLRTLHPADFAVSQEEILAWHRRHARLFEEDQYWFGACFHLARLLALDLDNPALRLRHQNATQRLVSEQPRRAQK